MPLLVELCGRLGVELLERDVDGARQMLGGVLLGRQHVDKLDAVREQSLQLREDDDLRRWCSFRLVSCVQQRATRRRRPVRGSAPR